MEKPGTSQIHQNLCPKQSKTSTDALRAKIRDIALKDRANARSAVYDGVRLGLGEIKTRLEELEGLTEKDVHGLSRRIKRKRATAEDMYRLSYAFLQSNENINAFINTTGALQVVLKELTGTNADSQVCAVECLCNLSLGEAHVCEKISNAAGSYLITYIDSSEERIKRTSLWTLANILATSIKATQMLLQMQLMRKLWANYVSINEDYSEDAAICLQLISARGKEILKENEWQFVMENIRSKDPTAAGGEYHLQIVFNFGFFNSDMQLQDTDIMHYLVDYALSNLRNSTELQSEKDRLRIVYAVRVLGNLFANHHEAYNFFELQLTRASQSLSAFFNKLFGFSEKLLNAEVLWLLKNAVVQQKHKGLSELRCNEFLRELCIPRGVIEIV